MVRLLRRVFSSVLERTGAVRDPAARSLVSRMASTGVWGLVAFTAAGTCGIDTAPLIGTLGVTGATVGFACKDIGANVAAGIMLAWQRPFVFGARITVGTGRNAVEGIVDHWDMRYLYLRCPRTDAMHHIPNTTVYTSVLTLAAKDVRYTSNTTVSGADEEPSEGQTTQQQPASRGDLTKDGDNDKH
jgi:small-conductance mechanosensitive channel